MLTYSLENRGNTGLYQYLYQCIKNDILSNVLAADTKLPSKRSFAKNLGVSNITVENAYAQLQAEGYIYSIPKKGFYVTPLSDPVPSRTPRSSVQTCSPELIKYKADFVNNRINPDNFPFSIWSKLIHESFLNHRDELMNSCPCGGLMKLRSAICAHLKQFRGMDVTAEQIIVGAGTEYLYGLLIQLLGYDKIYALENPGYHKLAHIYESYGVSCKYIPIKKQGIDLWQLEASMADIAHISPSHHYPTGIVTPIGKRYELLGWAARNDRRYIIEDDYDSEFRLSGRPIPPLQTIDMSEKVIYMNTFTKSISSTIRISYMVLPPHLLEQFYKRLGFYSCTVSNFEQYTLANFIHEGYFEKHINRMRNYYRDIRDELLLSIKKSPLASRCHISEEDAGLHFLMTVETTLSDAELLQKAQQNGLHLSVLSQFYFENAFSALEHTLVINYSGLKKEEISDAVELLVSTCYSE